MAKQAAVDMSKLSLITGWSLSTQHRLHCSSARDLTLRTESRDFRIHRKVLSASSPVFAAMLQADLMVKLFLGSFHV